MNLAVAYSSQETPLMRVSRNTTKTLQVRILTDLNLITVRGWSVLDEIHEKYTQLQIGIESHLCSSQSLNLYFRYKTFDLITLKYLFLMIRTLNVAHTNGKAVKIYWSGTSERGIEMEEMGRDLAELCDFNFKVSSL